MKPIGFQPLWKEPLVWIALAFLGFGLTGAALGQTFRHKALSHATDCTSLTSPAKKANQFCWEIDDNAWYVCEPTSGDCDTAGEWVQLTGGTGAFDDAIDPAILNTTTKDVVIGAGAINASKLSIDGDADQVQVSIQGHSAQAPDILVIEDSTGLELFNITPVGHVGIGVATPDGHLHVHEGTAGSVTAIPGANDFVVEISESGGMSILTPDDDSSQIVFGSPTDSLGARVLWTHTALDMIVGTLNSGGELQLHSGENVPAITIDSAQRVGIGLDAPATNLHVSESTTDTVPTVEVEQLSTGDAGLQFSIVGDAYAMGIDNSDADQFKISYAAVAGTAALGTNDRFVIDSAGDVGVGTATPEAQLHVSGGDIQLDNNESINFDDAAGDPKNVILMNVSDEAVIGFGADTVKLSPGGAVRLTVTTAGNVTVAGFVSVGDILKIVPKVTAPVTCAIGDFYVDSSGAACACSATNTWSNMHATGTCV